MSDSVQMGYGSRAINCLNEYYSGDYFNLDEPETESDANTDNLSERRDADGNVDEIFN